MDIPTRKFGDTGLIVPILGLGAVQIGDHSIPEKSAENFLNGVLDSGVTLIDTARMYSASEERIGKYISHRRREFMLSTKVGYDIPGQSDWSYGCIVEGIEAALKRLRTDVIDIVHLHSCSVDILRRGDVIKALEKARTAGKVRVLAYSGENEALRFAVESSAFQSIQTSINICDQRVIEDQLKAAGQKGLGVIAKRPIANAPWKYTNRPTGQYVDQYWIRWDAMKLKTKNFGLDWDELALRFTAYLPGVHSAIVGTANLDHLRRNADAVKKGPLNAAIVSEIRTLFKSNDQNWTGQI